MLKACSLTFHRLLGIKSPNSKNKTSELQNLKNMTILTHLDINSIHLKHKSSEFVMRKCFPNSKKTEAWTFNITCFLFDSEFSSMLLEFFVVTP